MARIPFLLNARKLKQWQMVDWFPPRRISRHGSPPPTADRTVVHFILPQLQQQSDIRHQNCLLEEHRGLSKDTNRTQELATTKACANITSHKLDTALSNCINTCLGMHDEHMKRQHTCVLVCVWDRAYWIRPKTDGAVFWEKFHGSVTLFIAHPEEVNPFISCDEVTAG